MKRVLIDEKTCLKHKLSLKEFLVLLTLRIVGDTKRETTDLLNKKMISLKDGKYVISKQWEDVLDKILGIPSADDERVISLAKSMQECFPRVFIRPNGERCYFRGNIKEITNQLKRFFSRYGNYTDEEILDATKRYVASYHGEYSRMRLLKYFIGKDEKKLDGEGEVYVDKLSDLATFLENKDDEEDDIVEGKTEEWIKII